MPVQLMDLWSAILLSGVLVFLASSILHMVLPVHTGDFKKLKGEEAVLDVMRSEGVTPGEYMFPGCDSMKDMGNPEFIAKMNKGPVGFMIVVPNGPPSMGKSLAQWFAYTLVIGTLVAYVASIYLPAAPEYMDVFRLTSTIAAIGYCLSNVTNSIWKGSSWWVTTKFVFDGLIYAALTAGAFSWLWPS